MSEESLPFDEQQLSEATIAAVQEDFSAFFRLLIIESAFGPMVFEDAMLKYERRGIEPFQRKFFEDAAPSLHALRIGDMPPGRRFWLERTKKGSKDNDLSVCLLWLMAFPKRPILCQVVAADQQQAAIIKRRAEHILFYNEWLRDYVRITTNKILSTNGLGTTVIEATDKASAHGETPALLVLNELVHVAKWDVMEAHYNNASGVPRGVMIVSTNAGYRGTKAERWKQNAEKQPKRWSMHVWKKKAPWLSEADVADAKRINLPSEFARLFNGCWPSGKGDVLTEEAIEGIFRENLEWMKGDEEGWIFVAGLDLGRSKDHSGVVVLGANKAEKRIRVGYLRDLRPTLPNSRGVKQVDTEEVKREIVFVHQRFNPVWFGYDPAEGAWHFEQELRMHGVGMTQVTFSGTSLKEMAEAFVKSLPYLESPESEVLRRDVAKFTWKHTPPDKVKIESLRDEHGHADVGTALLIALPEAIELVGGFILEVSDKFFHSSNDTTEEMVEKAKREDPFLDELLSGAEEMVGRRFGTDPDLPLYGGK
jgi:hypothetical protein